MNQIKEPNPRILNNHIKNVRNPPEIRGVKASFTTSEIFDRGLLTVLSLTVRERN
jgi:hypothetical protein